MTTVKTVVREATLKDAGFLAAARNDKEYRVWGLHGWVHGLDGVKMGVWLSSGTLYVIEDWPEADRPRSCGFLRMDEMDSPGGDVSVYVLPHYNGRGHGVRALTYFVTLYPRMRALIRKDNVRSRHVFERAGFYLAHDQGDGVYQYLVKHGHR